MTFLSTPLGSLSFGLCLALCVAPLTSPVRAADLSEVRPDISARKTDALVAGTGGEDAKGSGGAPIEPQASVKVTDTEESGGSEPQGGAALSSEEDSAASGSSAAQGVAARSSKEDSAASGGSAPQGEAARSSEEGSEIFTGGDSDLSAGGPPTDPADRAIEPGDGKPEGAVAAGAKPLPATETRTQSSKKESPTIKVEADATKPKPWFKLGLFGL